MKKKQYRKSKRAKVILLKLLFVLPLMFLFSEKTSAKENSLKSSLKNKSARVVIVPLDDRPATTQFAEMIGNIGNAEVIFPPREMLGKFLDAGKSEEIIQWLGKYDFSQIDALIISADMLSYGGFMNSRMSHTPLATALNRLSIISEIRRKNPRLPIYAFNVVRRVALSASAANRAYRDKIARWAVLADETRQKPAEAKLREEFVKLESEIPRAEIEDYLAVRRRNLQVNFQMLKLAQEGVLTKLLLLQDDAHRYGLHRLDQEAVKEQIEKLGLKKEQAELYNGADEGASVLLSRAVLSKNKFTPRVHVVYSSEAAKTHLGDFEDQPIETSVRKQIENSGAVITENKDSADYTLYVNAPQQTEKDFQIFMSQMVADIKRGRRVAIADILYRVWGGGDQRLVEILEREKLLDRIIGYASWGTPGNALGTVVPQANMYVFARQKLYKNAQIANRIEAAQIKFLFHRWVGDYIYHVLVRAPVNKYARQELKIEVDEFDKANYEKFNRLAVEKTKPLTEKFFAENFKNRFYQTGAKDGEGIILKEMQNLEIRLPWARTFEIFTDYEFRFKDIQK